MHLYFDETFIRLHLTYLSQSIHVHKIREREGRDLTETREMIARECRWFNNLRGTPEEIEEILGQVESHIGSVKDEEVLDSLRGVRLLVEHRNRSKEPPKEQSELNPQQECSPY